MKISDFSAENLSEDVYYSRHFGLPGFNSESQQKLRNARVLIIGVGGLGCPTALYLAGAGVGTIALCDPDEVSITNLHRQILFNTIDIGEKKVSIASQRLKIVNPYIHIETFSEAATIELLDEIISKYDIVIDCTDNFSSKYAINDACEATKVPLVYGSIFQFEGQVSVFHYPTLISNKGISYRDLYPDAPPEELAQNCGEAGVMGVLPGIIGAMQANEVIKIITGLGEPLAGYLLVFDALKSTIEKLKLSKREKSTTQQENKFNHNCKQISYNELNELLQSNNPPILIDVREKSEHDLISLGGSLIPLATLPLHLDKIPKDRDIVIYCKSGSRSARAVLYLQSIFTERTIFNLKGGLDAYSF
jgi:Dinucleotide-utilizing enzymes involved in molybdopterin and thiamine biosynthesis family 2